MRLSVVGLAVVTVLSIGACSSSDDDTTVYKAKGISCDVDQASDDMKDVIEKVGGLVFDDFRVHYAEATKLGVIALVDGDAKKAADVLLSKYDVSIVTKIGDADSPGRQASFAQVRKLVADTCS